MTSKKVHIFSLKTASNHSKSLHVLPKTSHCAQTFRPLLFSAPVPLFCNFRVPSSNVLSFFLWNRYWQKRPHRRLAASHYILYSDFGHPSDSLRSLCALNVIALSFLRFRLKRKSALSLCSVTLHTIALSFLLSRLKQKSQRWRFAVWLCIWSNSAVPSLNTLPFTNFQDLPGFLASHCVQAILTLSWFPRLQSIALWLNYARIFNTAPQS